MENSTRTERRVLVDGDDVVMADRYRGKAGHFEHLEEGQERQVVTTIVESGDPVAAPARSVEGWIIIVSGIHEEAQEDDLHSAFDEFGKVKNLHLNLDRRSGFVKGYAFVEYEEFREAQKAISKMNGATIFDERVDVAWAFTRDPSEKLMQ